MAVLGAPVLLPHHLAMLREESGLPDDVIAERGYRSVTVRAELLRLGFKDRQARVPALLVPLHGIDGELCGYALRPDAPRSSNGRILKYEEPKDSTKQLDVPPRCRPSLGNPGVTLYITEGAKKADAIVAQGGCAINISGVWAWRGTNQYGGKVALPHWDRIALNERLVRVVFDSDVMEKIPVRLALLRLQKFLASRGAVVEIVQLPAGESGAKQGIDGFLAAGRTLLDLEPLSRAELDRLPEPLDGLIPEIVVSGRHLHEIAQDCWSVLEKRNERRPSVFQRERALVHVRDDDDGRPFVHEWSTDDLEFTLDRFARFVREVKDDDEFVVKPARLPEDVARDVLVAWNKPLPVLAGITGTPVFAADGSLSTEEGYQQRSRLFYRPVGAAVPDVPEVPSRDDLERARSLLLDELLGDFPFVNAASRANTIGAFLTPIVRDLVAGPTPLHALDAPTPGSGKGLLTDVISHVATGHPAAVESLPRDDDELRKRITARLRESAQVVLLDNIDREVHSPTLAAVLTSTVWSDRILGSTATGRFPNRCLWLATGNNLRVSGELVRRTVWIRLDPRVDRPWERTGFRHDPLLPWVSEHRHELVWALLVLVRHWLANDKPAWTGRPMGSFESWCRTVGGVLAAAGIEGFLENREELYRRADAESEEWRDFTSAWWEAFGDGPVQTAELFPLVQDQELLPSLFATLRGQPSERSLRTRLGKAITTRRDRGFGTLFVRELGSDGHRKGKVFALERAELGTGEVRGSAEVPQQIRPDSGSDAEPAEHAEPVSLPCVQTLSPHLSPEGVPGPKGLDQVPQVPQVPPPDSDSPRSPAEHALELPLEVPHLVPHGEAPSSSKRDGQPCLGGCGRWTPPGQKCAACATRAVAEQFDREVNGGSRGRRWGMS